MKMKIEYEFQYFSTHGKWSTGSFWDSKPAALAHYAVMVKRFPTTGYRLIERQISEKVIRHLDEQKQEGGAE